MKPKTIKIIYWVVTVIFSLAMLMSGILSLIQTEQSKELFVHLGYPIYVLTITGIAKILGIFAVLQTRYRTLKEWAYAGFAFDILGAAISMAFVGDGITAVISTSMFLVLMFISYFLWKKVDKLKKA